MFDCGVPREHCSGGVVVTQAAVREGYKAHGDYDSARRCAKRFAQAMTTPDGPIILPPKPTRLKKGKSGEKGGKGGRRFIVPKTRG